MSKEDTQTGGLCFLAKKAEANTPQLIGFLLVVLDAPQRQPLRCGGWSAGGLFLVDTGTQQQQKRSSRYVPLWV